MPDSARPARPDIVAAFRTQAGWCRDLGSPFTARLLDEAAGALERGGPPADLLGDWPGEPVADALALRFAGALHDLVLSGDAPALAALYPPATMLPDGAALWAAVEDALAAHRERVTAFLASAPQTNEARRSAVLLGGFLEVAAATGLPLRALEIGASAGLNQVWDRFRYRLGGFAWGDPDSPVTVEAAWEGPTPRLDAPVRVAARGACDIGPVDLEDPDRRRRLQAYVWADQRQRMELLSAAIGLARDSGVRVEAADAADWLERALAVPAAGTATVLYHSVVWQYMPAASQARIEALMADKAQAATAGAPLAWLRFEPGADKAFELTLECWPGPAGRRLLARAHPHGTRVEWLAGG